jgi:Fe-Mn family superoxide dismutase
LTHPTRRRFVFGAASTVTAASTLVSAPRLAFGQAPFKQGPLPWADDALAPVISAQTVGLHYGKHHAGYYPALNRLLEGDNLAGQPLLEIIKSTAVNPTKQAIFNNAGQIWAHDFYWMSLRANGGGKPSGRLLDMINRSFGDYDKFREQFIAFTVGQFGSGWGWLCAEGDRLTLRRTSNADTPVYVQGVKPLLTIDVWEHAYYVDYQNRRGEYVTALVDKLLNWEFAEKNLGPA